MRPAGSPRWGPGRWSMVVHVRDAVLSDASDELHEERVSPRIGHGSPGCVDSQPAAAGFETLHLEIRSAELHPASTGFGVDRAHL